MHLYKFISPHCFGPYYTLFTELWQLGRIKGRLWLVAGSEVEVFKPTIGQNPQASLKPMMFRLTSAPNQDTTDQSKSLLKLLDIIQLSLQW